MRAPVHPGRGFFLSTIRTMQTHFLPWLKQLISGLVLVGIGLFIAATSKLEHPYLAVAGLVVAAIGVVLVKRAAAREHGQKVERDAIKGLIAVADKWGVSVEPNVSLRSGGDLDLLLTRADDARFAVEIKSHEGVLLKRSLFGAKESLVRLNGKKLDRDPCEQVLVAADEVDATPVIWLPSAEKAKTFHLKSGVIVVQGGLRQLRQAIGAKSWWSL